MPDARKPVVIAVIQGLSGLCGVISAFMILASVFITCQMIFVRAVLNQSTIWQTEAVIYLMIAATLIGLPYVQLRRGHVGVDLIPGLLSAKARKILAVFVLGLTLLMIGMMTFYAWEMFHFAWKRGWKSETVWAVRLWIPYIFIPLGFGLFSLQLASDLWLVLTGRDNPLTANAHGLPSTEETL